MNVTSIANLYSSLQTTSAKAATTDPVQKGLEKASTRIEGQLQAAGVRLSSYGQVKSGFARIEDAGKTLAKTDNLSVADTKKALQSMVAAYNDTRTAAAATSPGSASNAANTLRRTASTDTTRQDLQTLGITQKSDGSLSIDTKKLDQALAANPDSAKAVATRVGGQFQQNASRALSESGGISKTLNSLNTQNQQLESRLANLQALSSAQSYSANSNSYSGIASYQRIFSM